MHQCQLGTYDQSVTIIRKYTQIELASLTLVQISQYIIDSIQGQQITWMDQKLQETVNQGKLKQVPQQERKLRTIKSQQCIMLDHSDRSAWDCRKEGQKLQKSFSQQFDELRKLVKEKDKVIKQLNCLKEGAFVALKQKQEIINKFKDQSQAYFHICLEDEKQQMQKQLNKHVRRIKQLSEECKQISEKCQNQRSFFFEQVYSKEAIIQELSSRIASLQVKNDELKKQNNALQAKIAQYQNYVNAMAGQIEQLKNEILLNYKLSYNSFQKHEQYGNETLQQLNQNQSSCLSIQEPDKYIKNQMQRIKNYYQNQLRNMQNFYQSQLGLLKQLCQKQFCDNANNRKRTYQTQEFSDQQNNQNQSICQLEMLTLKSQLKPRSFYNLRSQLKKLSQLTDERESQKTSNFFKYYSRVGQGLIRPIEDKDSPVSTFKLLPTSSNQQKQMKQVQTKFEVSQSHQKAAKEDFQKIGSRRQLALCLGSGLFGVVLGASLMKIVAK